VEYLLYILQQKDSVNTQSKNFKCIAERPNIS